MIQSKVLIEYYDHNEEFAKHLPKTGTIIKKCVSIEGDTNWFLISLDDPFEYMSNPTNKYPAHSFYCDSILVRSKWEGVEIGSAKQVAVYILLPFDKNDLNNAAIDTNKLFHVAWGYCTIN